VRHPIAFTGDLGQVEIFNLAAVHTTPGHEEWEYFWTNINGAIEVCRFADAINANQMTFTSSISVYGPAEVAKDENGQTKPQSAYGMSKLLAEQIHLEWQAGSNERRLVIVRPAVIFGVGEGGNFTRLAKALRLGVFAFPGRSDTIKACAYVGELVHSIMFARSLARDVFLYNLAYPRRYTSRQICSEFHAVAGFRNPALTIPKWAMMLIGLGFELLASIGLKTSVNRARLSKLIFSTDIVPGRLLDAGYVFQTDLAEGIRRWQRASGGDFT
jgi:nucleoside-diphosphate-sugar epimerase